MADDRNTNLSLLRRMNEEIARGMDEDAPEPAPAQRMPDDDPFSWQLPLQPTPNPWGWRDELEDELSAVTQRHLERTVRFADEVATAPSSVNPPRNASHAFDAHIQRGSAQSDSSRKTLKRLKPPRMDCAPSESSFLESYPKGNATLSFPNDGKVESIQNVNVHIIEERCPVLAMAFENSRSGPQLYLETLTARTALPFLRFLYSDSYALVRDSEDFYEDVPTSVLLHCQLYRLGDIYDLPELKSQAYVNILRQCEFGCCAPQKPIDLCAAIRYVYEYLSEHDHLKDAIVNYCVACFLQHRLAQDDTFRSLAYELRPFHQDLAKNCMNREYENETAAAIIQMPFKPYIPETYASREDVVFHFHADEDVDASPKKRKRPDLFESAQTVLPLRPNPQVFNSPPVKNGVADADYKFGSKRRVSSAGASSSLLSAKTSTVDNVELPLRPQPEGSSSPKDPSKFEEEDEYYNVEKEDASSTTLDTLVSDFGFEIVPGPSAGQGASDSDSDSNTLVEVTHEEAVPSEVGTSAVPVASADTGESDSESEWTLV